MAQPDVDEPAYTGDIIVKSETHAKSRSIKASGVDKVRQAIESLNTESQKRLTIERLELDPKFLASVNKVIEGNMSPIDFQILINKEVSTILHREALKLTTFIKNNQ